jgi:glycosyltransferase involved in cell wall biosynthesis
MFPENPLTIIFLAPFGIRPKGTLIARMLPLAEALQQIGHRVEIIAPPYTNPEDSGVIEMHRGVRLTNISLSSLWKPLATLVMAWRMFRQSRVFRPDVVHLFKPKGYGGLAAMLMVLLRRFGLPMPHVVVDTDDWEGRGGMNELHAYSSMEKRVFAFQEGWLLSHASAVTVASRELEKMVRASGVQAERILYLPNCVEDLPPGDGSLVRRTLGIPGGVPLVLLYTRFFEFNQDTLHKLLTEIHRQMPEACFLVVGKGRLGEEQQLAVAAELAGYQQSLYMAGWVEPAELPHYLAAGDVAIYPFDDTLINRCKCPAKLTELMRAGVAVVADRVGQIGEYIQHDVSGILCNSGNYLQMATAVTGLLRDPSRRMMIGTAARERLGTQFTWKSYAKTVEHFYQRGR